MDSSGKMDFYKKAILYFKAGATIKDVVPFYDGETVSIRFLFSSGLLTEELPFYCGRIEKDNFQSINEDIYEIYRICVSEIGAIGKIFPCICKTCGKVYFSSNHRENPLSSQCTRCKEDAIKKYIESEKNCSNQQFVYLMESVGTNSLKIGYSTNPEARKKSLQTGNHSEINIVALLMGGQGLERRLHNMFSSYRMCGEWFSDVPEIREYFEKNRLYRE